MASDGSVFPVPTGYLYVRLGEMSLHAFLLPFRTILGEQLVVTGTKDMGMLCRRRTLMVKDRVCLWVMVAIQSSHVIKCHRVTCLPGQGHFLAGYCTAALEDWGRRMGCRDLSVCLCRILRTFEKPSECTAHLDCSSAKPTTLTLPCPPGFKQPNDHLTLGPSSLKKTHKVIQ